MDNRRGESFRRFVPLFSTAVALTLGLVVGWSTGSNVSATNLDRVVAMEWGDGRYGPSFYGAHVYLEPISTGYSVRARVYIGRGNDYFHDCGELGIAKSDSEAVSRWGTI